MNNKLGRSPYVFVWFYVIFCSIATFQEYYSHITPEDFKILLCWRIFLLGSAIPIGFVLRKNPFSVWANSFLAINFMFYTMVGHYYFPLYYACFLQTLFGFSFLCFTSRRLHLALVTIKAVGFCAFYLYTYDLVKYKQGAETKEDFIMTIVMIWGFGILVHHLFTAERGLKEAAHDRFALLGRHASHIVHDIKGAISIPQLYMSEALASIENKDFEKTKKYLTKMNESLSRTEKTIFDLNQLSRIATGDGKPFGMDEAVCDVLDMLSKRLHDVNIQVDGDFEYNGDRGIISSIFFNLILNSLENFNRSQTADPEIRIQIKSKERSIIVTDNGGGFSEESLSSLKGYSPTLSTTSNSGLGLYLVRENLRAIKGKVSFKNIAGGAQVEIKLG